MSSEQMPRIWWSPWLGRFLRQLQSAWSIGYLEVETGHYREQLPDDAVELTVAAEETGDLERRPWQAKPGEPICNRMYSGEYWVAKTCIKVLGHDGGHADWYGRTWNQDERDGVRLRSAGDGAADVRVEWGADLGDTEDSGPTVCGGEWSARVLAEREPENRLLRRTVTTSEWEVVDR